MRKTRGRCRSSFFLKEAKQPLFVATVGPAKHPGCSGMETVAGLSRPPRHTLHMEKVTFGTRLASFFSLTNGGKVYVALSL